MLEIQVLLAHQDQLDHRELMVTRVLKVTRDRQAQQEPQDLQASKVHLVSQVCPEILVQQDRLA